MSDDKTIIAENPNFTIFEPPAQKRACLIQYNGPSMGKRHILDEPEMIVGRNQETAAIHINDPSISRKHAKICQTGQTVEIEDMGSSNGTFVQDSKVTRQELKNGDMVRLGTVLFKFFANSNIDNVLIDRIYTAATIDAGTQVFNKKYLNETLKSEFKVSRAYKRNLSVILYDLDFFKNVNDTLGHNAGDVVLKSTAQIVKAGIRKDDTLGRWGGEEFMIILPNTDGKTARELAERLREKVANNVYEFGGKKIKQTISIGIAELATDITTPEQMVEVADKKLYKSKHDGRNRVTY